MSFIWPAMLILLLLIPLAAWLYIRLWRRRQRQVAQLGSMGLLQSAGRQLGRRRHIPPGLFLAGLSVLILSLARPQAVASLPRVEGSVILAFDVSGSMAADDLKPTRMEAAKAAARAFVERQPRSVQIGVVAFSESGLTVQPPTNDQQAIVATINRLSPQRGTSLGMGILAALDTLAKAAQPPERLYSNVTPTPVPLDANGAAAIVLLTDGENTAPPDPLEAALAAAASGVRIYTVGIGSAAGVPLHINGFNVHTSLDEATLQQIAQLSEGAYYNATSPEDLQAVYENLDLRLVVRDEKTELTALLAGLGTLLLLTGGIGSLLWFGRMP